MRLEYPISELNIAAAKIITELGNNCSIILLHGELGAGKTTLAGAIVRAWLNMDDLIVTSPSFNILHQYRNNQRFTNHLDLYRLEKESELDQIGFDEVLSIDDSLTIIEWPKLAMPRLYTRTALSIAIEFCETEDVRSIASSFIPDLSFYIA